MSDMDSTACEADPPFGSIRHNRTLAFINSATNALWLSRCRANMAHTRQILALALRQKPFKHSTSFEVVSYRMVHDLDGLSGGSTFRAGLGTAGATAPNLQRYLRGVGVRM